LYCFILQQQQQQFVVDDEAVESDECGEDEQLKSVKGQRCNQKNGDGEIDCADFRAKLVFSPTNGHRANALL
jgi:hypothetical protein